MITLPTDTTQSTYGDGYVKCWWGILPWGSLPYLRCSLGRSSASLARSMTYNVVQNRSVTRTRGHPSGGTSGWCWAWCRNARVERCPCKTYVRCLLVRCTRGFVTCFSGRHELRHDVVMRILPWKSWLIANKDDYHLMCHIVQGFHWSWLEFSIVIKRR